MSDRPSGHERDMSAATREEATLPAHDPAAHELAPGLPPHELRRTDTDPRVARRAERQVALMFAGSALSTIAFVVAFFAVPLDTVGNVALSTVLLGTTLGLALFLIGAGAIHWAKTLMSDEEVVQERHPLTSSREDSSAVVADLRRGVADSGFGRRKLIAGSLAGAMSVLLLPVVVLLRDLGPLPGRRLRETLWQPGMRIVTDVTGEPIRAADLRVGALVNAVPEILHEVEEEEGTLNERAKAPVILVRMEPGEIQSQQGDDWDYEGILCFSKICTHAGCPINLYEQQTHHLLCPCHQSTFDLAEGAEVIFGPADRPLPQLPITIDDEGYLVARRDFTEPVGPSFWERG